MKAQEGAEPPGTLPPPRSRNGDREGDTGVAGLKPGPAHPALLSWSLCPQLPGAAGGVPGPRSAFQTSPKTAQGSGGERQPRVLLVPSCTDQHQHVFFFLFFTILSLLPTSIICSWRPPGLLAAAKQGFAFPKCCSSPLLGAAGHEAKSSPPPAGARSTSRARAAAVGEISERSKLPHTSKHPP